MTTKTTNDDELFDDDFGKWLEANGVILELWDKSKGFWAIVDLSKLKLGVQYRATQAYNQGKADGVTETIDRIVAMTSSKPFIQWKPADVSAFFEALGGFEREVKQDKEQS